MEKLISNKKNVIIGLSALGVIILLIILSKFMKNNIDNVNFESIEQENIPNQITEVLPNYRMKEKALVAKVNNEIFVIVTRGEKNSAGYEVVIDELTLNKGGENELIVYAKYTDPKPGDVNAEILTYPFTVIKTDLNKLPSKVILQKEYAN